MKQGKPLITFVMAALALMLAIYFGVYLLQAMEDPYATSMVYPYTANDSVAAEGLVVREALLLPAQTGIVELTRAEGEKVGAGQEIALVYRDLQAQADQTQIEELQMEVELLEYAVNRESGGETAARLDEDILQAMVELRSSYALGDCTQLREQVMAVKSGVLQRGYTYGEGVTAADLSSRLRQLSNELSVLTSQSARATTRVTAPRPGVFSSLVDGYEALLTPESVTQLTPSSLQSLMDNPAGEDSSAMGKLLTSDKWSFAANLPREAAQRLEEGDVATLRFTGELDRDVEMTVERIGPSEGTKTLVVFSSNRYLTLTTQLRHQTAELIFDSWSGLRIPKEALRLVEPTPGEDGSAASSQTTRVGVYALVAGRTEFREVRIITEGSDFYVVEPVGTGRKILRAGDEVIVRATGLQDGLLLEF